MNAVLKAPVEAAAEAVDPFINGLYQGKWDIWDPREVNYVERTDFLKSICGHIDHADELEKVILHSRKTSITATELRDLANTYVKFKNKGARLPKFSKWVLGMWTGNKEYQKMLAEEGQKAANRKIIMSVDVVDILRCAATKHFHSCFRRVPDKELRRDAHGRVDVRDSEYWHGMPVKIAEECPGIGIVYVEDENGMIMGRQWMHHARIKETREDIVVLTENHYGCVEANNVARLMQQKFGIRVGFRHYPWYSTRRVGVPVEFVGCFTADLHHDLDTWSPNPEVTFITPEI